MGGVAAIPVALASTAVSAAGQAKQAAVTRAQTALQETQAALSVAERERATQANLRQTLARQNNSFAAVGADPSSGSPLALGDAARKTADDNLSLIAAQGDAADLVRAARRATQADDRLQSLIGLGGNAAQALLKWT